MSRRGGHRRLSLSALVGLAALAGTAAFPAGASSLVPTISAYNEPGIYARHYWLPSTETVGSGGAVKFRNEYTATYHGLKFTGGPEQPSCTGLPAAAAEPSGALGVWEGECKFTKPGAYTFICTVHPAEMTGTITVPGTLKAKTTAASGETQTTATLNGAIEPEGNPSEYHFEYGTSSVSESKSPATSLGASDFASHPVSFAAEGLLPGKTYHVELAVTYEGKTVQGGETTFTTLPVTAPTATTGVSSGVKETEATLKGTVATGGEATEYDFEYGTDESYGKATEVKALTGGAGSQGVSATITGLTPGTTYHYRLVAKNAVGPATGKDVTFATVSPPPPPSGEPPPSPPSEPSPGPQGGSPPTPAPSPSVLPSKLEGVLLPIIAGSLRLKTPARGSAAVRGSIDVSAFGAGGRLEVDLVASAASLARHGHARQVVVGRLVRGSVIAGHVTFSVTLNARGKSALHRHHKLVLTVKVVFTPPGSQATVLVRKVVIRA